MAGKPEPGRFASLAEYDLLPAVVDAKARLNDGMSALEAQQVTEQLLHGLLGDDVQFQLSNTSMMMGIGQYLSSGSFNAIYGLKTSVGNYVIRLPLGGVDSSGAAIIKFLRKFGDKLVSCLHAMSAGAFPGSLVLVCGMNRQRAALYPRPDLLGYPPTADCELVKGVGPIVRAISTGNFELAIVMERAANGIYAAHTLTEARLSPVFVGSLLALNIIDRSLDFRFKGLYHTDLKASNILFTGLGSITDSLRRISMKTLSLKAYLSDVDDVITLPRSGDRRTIPEGSLRLDILNPMEVHSKVHTGGMAVSSDATPEQPAVSLIKVNTWRIGHTLVGLISQEEAPLRFWNVIPQQPGLGVPLGINPFVVPSELAGMLASLLQVDPVQRTSDLQAIRFGLEDIYNREARLEMLPPEWSYGKELGKVLSKIWDGLNEESLDIYKVYKLSRYFETAMLFPYEVEGGTWMLSQLLPRLAWQLVDISSRDPAQYGGGKSLLETVVSLDSKRNLLHMAVGTGSTAMVKAIVAACEVFNHRPALNALLEAQDEWQQTPAALGLALQRWSSVQVLLDYAKAYANDSGASNWLSMSDKDGRTLLHGTVRWPITMPAEPPLEYLQRRTPSCILGPWWQRDSGSYGQVPRAVREKIQGLAGHPRLDEALQGERDGDELCTPACYNELRRHMLLTLLGFEDTVKGKLFAQVEWQASACDAGDNPLHCLAKLGDFVGLQLMDQHGGQYAQRCLSERNAAGRTPLEEARFCNSLVTMHEIPSILARGYTRVGNTGRDILTIANIHKAYAPLRAWLESHTQNDTEYKAFSFQLEDGLHKFCMQL